MTLNCVEFDCSSELSPPAEIVRFLQSVDALVEEHRVDTATHFRGFVPSDYPAIYCYLDALYNSQLLCGTKFCEWGSGISIVASLAAMIGYESCGIEYDQDLSIVADGICREFDIPVELVNGSFIPDGVDDLVDTAFADHDGELALHTSAGNAYEELGYQIDDFDLIFAFPWPNDVELIHQIFDRFASPGALLMTYLTSESIALYRKS